MTPENAAIIDVIMIDVIMIDVIMLALWSLSSYWKRFL